MSTPRATKSMAGLRLAAIVYVAVLMLGLGGAGAHALWKMSGSAVGTVVAGSWAPKKIAATSVTCERSDSWDHANITVTWQTVDADAYSLEFTGNNVDLARKTTTLSETFKVNKPGLLGSVDYKLSITPTVGSGSEVVLGNPTKFNVTVKNATGVFGSVKCSAL